MEINYKINMHTNSCKRFSNFVISCLTFTTESSALVLCMAVALSLYSPFSLSDNDLHFVAEKQFFSCKEVQLKDSKTIQYSYTVYIQQKKLPADRMHSAWCKLYPDTALIFLGSLTYLSPSFLFSIINSNGKSLSKHVKALYVNMDKLFRTAT